MRSAGLALLLALLAGAVSGQTVYRCGPEGRSYSDQPCPGGREIDAADPRTPAQRREGELAARREMEIAEQLRRERQVREAEHSRAEAKSARSAAKRPPHRASEPPPDTSRRTARVPQSPKQKAGEGRP